MRVGDRVRVTGYLSDYPQELLCASDLAMRSKLEGKVGTAVLAVGRYFVVQIDGDRVLASSLELEVIAEGDRVTDL